MEQSNFYNKDSTGAEIVLCKALRFFQKGGESKKYLRLRHACLSEYTQNNSFADFCQGC